MGIRGRQSRDPKSTVPALSVVTSLELVRRPQPPRDLTDEQAEEWRAIVNRLPADWFPRETHGMLAQLCRHTIAARRIAQLIQAFESQEPVDVEAYDRLLKMQEREGRAISSLATRMRISQHSTYAKDKKRGPIIEQSPWDDNED